MAKEKDVTTRPKFFARKKGVTDDMLCERCVHHQFVIIVRHGCDAIMHSNTRAKTSLEAAAQVGEGTYIHAWCVEEDEVPDCLEHFKEVKALR